MLRLDRAGIFKAQPVSWTVRSSQQSGAIALAIEFKILAQLDGAEWNDWAQYDEYSIFGDFWVVKSDGTINTTTVESLARTLGWDGDLVSVVGEPPAEVVQITVREEEYQGRKRMKVAWLNPGDFSPMPESATPDQVQNMQRRFGSLLRAAAAGAAAPAKASKSKRTAKAEVGAAIYAGKDAPTETTPPPPDDDLPF